MRPCYRVPVLALLFTILIIPVMTMTQTASMQSGRAPIDVSRLGPQVGERVPDFSLTDQFGKLWTLSSITGEQGAIIVFYRSADW